MTGLLQAVAVLWHVLTSLVHVPQHHTVSRSVHREPKVPAVWQRVADCESGGDWHVNTGNGYYGGLQITAGNAANYGYARPDLLSRADQIRLAQLILRDQGPTAWPICGPRAGLRRGD